MSETATEATATETTDQEQQKPTETVDFWKEKAREQEKRAKANAEAAKRLADIEDAQKTEAQKTAERIAKAEAEVATIPAKVADALRESIVALGVVPAEHKGLLTASDPTALLEQVKSIQALVSDKRKSGNRAPAEGQTPPPPAEDEALATVRGLFGGGS